MMTKKLMSHPRKPGKRIRTSDVARLEDIPNIGPAMAADLRQLKIDSPADLPGRDPYAMYDALCRISGQRHDPCVIDAFVAAVRFMEGGPNKPWWAYTAERKREIAVRLAQSAAHCQG